MKEHDVSGFGSAGHGSDDLVCVRNPVFQGVSVSAIKRPLDAIQVVFFQYNFRLSARTNGSEGRAEEFRRRVRQVLHNLRGVRDALFRALQRETIKGEVGARVGNNREPLMRDVVSFSCDPPHNLRLMHRALSVDKKTCFRIVFGEDIEDLRSE